MADISIYSRFRLRFLAAAVLALALSATAFAFLTAGDPASLQSLSAPALLLLTALAPPLAVSGVGLQPHVLGHIRVQHAGRLAGIKNSALEHMQTALQRRTHAAQRLLVALY